MGWLQVWPNLKELSSALSKLILTPGRKDKSFRKMRIGAEIELSRIKCESVNFHINSGHVMRHAEIVEECI